MKFKVTPKDLTIFIIFCIILLIVSALAVLNISSLLNSTEFFGLNFFAGFKPPYLLYTLIVFFAVLIAIFLSVSSYIFDREKGSKGIGFNFGEKEEKGYSRWAKENEIKNDKDVEKIVIKDQDSNAAGIPLINNGKEMWVDNGEYHNLVIGATGSGKTKCLVDPMIESLARKGESMIMTDPKGELYRDHSEMLRSKGYNIVVLNFRDPACGNAWNPLTLPYQLYKQGNTDKATELLEDVAQNILYDKETKGNDPFWEKTSADYFAGLALGLFGDAKEEEININSINYMSTVGEENFATSTYVKEYFTLKGENSSPYIYANGTINAPKETKDSVLSVFRGKIRMFASREQLSEMLSYSDFNMRDIGTKKTAVFLIIQDEKTTYHALATIFLKQVYETLVDVAHNSPKGKLPFRTNFILDEFANMPPLRDVTTMVTAARSRAIRFTFIIQNFAQLNDVYGKETAETIRSNCGNMIYLITTELAALEEISKLCGEVKSKEKDKTASTPLISVSDLQKLKLFEVVILRNRLNPFRTKLAPSFDIDWGTNFGNGKLLEREKKDLAIFDIKEFVKVQKRNKLFESLDNGSKEKNNVQAGGMPLGSIFNQNMPNMDNPFMNVNQEFSSGLSPFNIQSDINPKRENNNVIKEKEIDDSKFDKTEIFDFNSLNANQNQNNNKFDIDSLVKRIDAKIAELEKEEQLEKQNKLNEEKENKEEKLDNTIIERFDDIMKNNDDKISNTEPKINVDNDSVVVGDISDDEYYDDFFNDNE